MIERRAGNSLNSTREMWPATESNCRHEDFQSSSGPRLCTAIQKTKTNMFVIMSSLRKFSGDRRLSDSDMPPAKAQRRQVRKRCHFGPFGQAQGKLREKSFLDPSHSLGMTGMGSSPLRLCAFAGDNSAFGCGCSPRGEPLFPCEVWEKACVTIGRYWYLFKRLMAVSAGRFYRFEQIVLAKLWQSKTHPVRKS